MEDTFICKLIYPAEDHIFFISKNSPIYNVFKPIISGLLILQMLRVLVQNYTKLNFFYYSVLLVSRDQSSNKIECSYVLISWGHSVYMGWENEESNWHLMVWWPDVLFVQSNGNSNFLAKKLQLSSIIKHIETHKGLHKRDSCHGCFIQKSHRNGISYTISFNL